MQKQLSTAPARSIFSAGRFVSLDFGIISQYPEKEKQSSHKTLRKCWPKNVKISYWAEGEGWIFLSFHELLLPTVESEIVGDN